MTKKWHGTVKKIDSVRGIFLPEQHQNSGEVNNLRPYFNEPIDPFDLSDPYVKNAFYKSGLNNPNEIKCSKSTAKEERNNNSAYWRRAVILGAISLTLVSGTSVSILGETFFEEKDKKFPIIKDNVVFCSNGEKITFSTECVNVEISGGDGRDSYIYSIEGVEDHYDNFGDIDKYVKQLPDNENVLRDDKLLHPGDKVLVPKNANFSHSKPE